MTNIKLKNLLLESYGEVGNGQKFWDWPPRSIDLPTRPAAKPTAYVLFQFGRKISLASNWEWVLNLKGDTWFRKEGGPGAGYGLTLREFKIGKKSLTEFKGEYIHNVYRATIKYIPSEYTGESDPEQHVTTEQGLLWVIKSVDVGDVMKYIKSNMKKWVP